jgi:2-phospho-L-lactate/phosphoenolpyruvate guanylyltransferase
MRSELFAILAIKDPAYGKSRLSSSMQPSERIALGLWFAHRALACCSSVFNPERIVVMTPCDAIAARASHLGTHVLRETAFGDVNLTVSQASRYAVGLGAKAVLFIPTDLPFLEPSSLRMAAELLGRDRICLIVPDHHGTGTNVFGMAPPYADLFRFGEGSYERHCQLAKDANLEVIVHRDPSLMFDVDTPEDYRLWLSMCHNRAPWRVAYV